MNSDLEAITLALHDRQEARTRRLRNLNYSLRLLNTALAEQLREARHQMAMIGWEYDLSQYEIDQGIGQR